MRTSCLYIRNGKLDTKWRSRKTKSRKEKARTPLDGKFNTVTYINTRFPHVLMSLARMYFVKVWLFY